MDFERFKQLPNPEQLQKGGIGAAVGVAIWIVVYFLILSPVMNKKAELRTQIEAARSELEQNQRLVAAADAVAENYVDAGRELLQVASEKLAPSDPFRSPLGWVSGILQEYASAHGVKIQSLSSAGIFRETAQGRNAPPPIFEEYRMNLDLQAGYHQFGRFIADLEERLPYGKIDSFRMSGGRGEEGELSVVMRCGVPKFTEDGFPMEKRPQPSDLSGNAMPEQEAE